MDYATASNVNASVTNSGLVTSLDTGKVVISYKIVALGCDTTVSVPLGLTIPNVAPITADTVSIQVGLTIDLKDDSVPGFLDKYVHNHCYCG